MARPVVSVEQPVPGGLRIVGASRCLGWPGPRRRSPKAKSAARCPAAPAKPALWSG